MFGAMIGDIVGSRYEFDNIKTKDFPLFSEECDYTDDTIMTVAMAKAILRRLEEQRAHGALGREFQEILVDVMQDYGRRYPYPTGAYGGSFSMWLRSRHPEPYGSFGNGSAMRTSPCGLIAVELQEALALARAGAEITHNHPEGIKGAEAVSAAIFLAKTGKNKDEIADYIRRNYYDLDFTLDEIRPTYGFDGSCQGTVPQSIVAFLESDSFEDAIRNVISIGGDSDTAGAITGSIAWTYYSQPGRAADPSMLRIRERAAEFLPDEFIRIAEEFKDACLRRREAQIQTGSCTPIL